ncbi:HD domain-containing protein [Erwinia sp. CPCC 100877]|nr:HD domain-containing protein [Erwinia sp. CPCC 100877]
MQTQEELQAAVKHFLTQHQCLKTYNHCLNVGDYAFELAKAFLKDPYKAQFAGYLHDISAIYPNEERISVARKMGIDLYKEELAFPLIIHQKISKEMALRQFSITDPEILSAIECHTTLKGDYSAVDLVVFVADKIKWDQTGKPPYLDGLLQALAISLEHAAYYYIDYLLNHEIKVMHPWLLEAYRTLKQQVNSKSN